MVPTIIFVILPVILGEYSMEYLFNLIKSIFDGRNLCSLGLKCMFHVYLDTVQ